MLDKIYTKVVAVLMILITGILAVKSLFYHMDMAPLNMDNELAVKALHIWPVYLLLLICVVAVFSRLKNKLLKMEEEKLLRILIHYHLLVGIIWMVVANTKEGSDQYVVLNTAREFCKGDFTRLAANQYMGMYPFQLPLTLFYEPFFILFGNATPFLWQLINVFLICGIQVLLYRIGRKAITAEGEGNVILFAEFLNFPILLYVSFVYGTVIGLFFSLLAINLFMRTGEDCKTVSIVFSAVFMALACLLRTNNLIFLIALCIQGVIRSISEKRPRFLLVLLSFLLFLAGRQAVFSVYEARSGMEVSKGEPATLHIAMGLADNGERAPGWFNGYTWDTYIELEFDRERADAFAKEKIAESLNKFKENPAYAFRFFDAKLDSMWLNPDFQGLWNNEHHAQYIGLAPVINNLYHGLLREITVSILSFLMLVVYVGTFLYFLLNWKSFIPQQCSLALCFIGGFLFHVFWEAKAQYTIVYYSMLMPYAGAGLSACVNAVIARSHGAGKQEITKRN